MRKYVLLPFLIASLLASPALAQSRYTSWSDPDAKKTVSAPTNVNMDKLIDELNALVDEATKARAANPVFLQDLKALAKKYDPRFSNPWPRRVISEDFKDGNFSHNPAWAISNGEYRIEKGWGLRSVAVAATTQQNSGSQTSANQDPAAALLGALLKSALGGKSQSGSQGTATPPKPAASVIHTAANIANAFNLTMEISSWKAAGHFSIGPYQGRNQQAGYRLTYSAGQPLSLARISSRGTSVIMNSARPVKLEDKKVHTLRWTRDAGGQMQILIDDQPLIDVSATSFRDPFSGIIVINKGSDVIVKTLTLDDAG